MITIRQMTICKLQKNNKREQCNIFTENSSAAGDEYGKR